MPKIMPASVLLFPYYSHKIIHLLFSKVFRYNRLKPSTDAMIHMLQIVTHKAVEENIWSTKVRRNIKNMMDIITAVVSENNEEIKSVAFVVFKLCLCGGISYFVRK